MASAYEERREALREIDKLVLKSRKRFRDVQNGLTKAAEVIGQAPPDANTQQRLTASAMILNTIQQGFQVLQECLTEIDQVNNNAGYVEIFKDIDDDAKIKPEDPIAVLLGTERQAILDSRIELRQSIVDAQDAVTAHNPSESETLSTLINQLNAELKTAAENIVAAMVHFVPKQPGTVIEVKDIEAKDKG